MKKTILSICLLAFLLVVNAQDMNAVLFKVGDEAITATQFINTFNKNNSLSKTTEAELRDYLELYIHFKLKVKDGLDSQIDTASIFQRELTSYRYQSAQPYLTDKEVTEQLIKEAIERSKLMVRASHILIKCDLDASPKDSLAAYHKILDIRKKIVSGAITFPEAAFQFSDDPSVKDEMGKNNKMQYGNKGDLGYFSAFDLIYPFENAAFNMPVGNYSMPIRSQYGYHLIWVQDKQPLVSKINISQILLLDTLAHSGGITPTVKERLAIIEEALKQGEDFATLAEKNTDEPKSRATGGRLDPITPNLRPGDYIKQAISLEKDQISKPFPSVIGWHILKLHDLVMAEVKDDEVRYSMISKIQRDSRSSKSVESLITKLKKEYKFSEKGKKAALELLLKRLDKEKSMLPAADLMTTSGIEKLKPLATYANQTIPVEIFINYLGAFQGVDLNNQAQSFLNVQYENLVKENMIQYEFENLEIKYPEYKELISEYHHGMILFEMNNEKVWAQALKDSIELEAFYEEIKFNYLDKEGNPKSLPDVRSAVLTEYQNKLENEWLTLLRKRYPVWINEELFQSILKNK
jgi:peptidyl-prolyl cis-trans isomerase SurA